MHRTAQQHRMIAGRHRRIHMLEIDLELARRHLRAHHRGRHVLDAAELFQIAQEAGPARSSSSTLLVLVVSSRSPLPSMARRGRPASSICRVE